MRQFMRKAIQRVWMLVGVTLMIIAVPIALVTPILPIGLPLMVVGALIVLNSSDTAKRAFVRWRRRYPETGRRVRQMMRKMKSK
ncbi:MAG: hypothetical protein MI723_11415 [Caulobacterales bacterium]|nr:hypothetical protein [Caulobacterales bacterium]